MKDNRRTTLIITLLVLFMIAAVFAYAVNRSESRVVVLPQNKTDGAFTDKSNQAVNIKVAKSQIVSPKGDIVVRKGVTVHLRIVDTDDPEEVDIRIPDFDQSTTFSQNSAGDLDFKVDKAGRFPVYFQGEVEDEATGYDVMGERRIVTYLVVR